MNISGFFADAFRQIRNSRLARILLLIILYKFLIFYVLLKGFLFPRYLKPHYESDQHRTEQVLEDLTKSTSNPEQYDREH